MRILITGGAGFLGSHFSRKLINSGHEVLAVDNFYTGSKTNVNDLLASARFELLRHDVTIPLFVEVDAIVNMACPASPIHYQKFPVQTTKTNVLGAINMLGLAKRLKVPILQASTSEVYGDPEISPQSETYWGNVNPIGLRSCYDEGKRVAETLFVDYHHQYDVEIKIARIFNTYGPNMAINDGRVVSNFIVQALKNKPLAIYGDGTQTRSFCYVSDLIEGLETLLFSKKEIVGPINLGNPNACNMLDLASRIIEISNSSSTLTFEPLPQDDPKQRNPDITLAKKYLGWRPKIGLNAGLKETIAELKTRI